jgi:monoterpene epsilon-lactone hydrolase
VPSFRSHLVVLLFRMIGVKRAFTDLDLLRKLIARSQVPGAERPPAFLRARYQVSSTQHQGWTCYTVTSRIEAGARCLLYLHGGAYVHQIMRPQWELVGRLVDVLGCEVCVPIYPLAPGHGYRDVFPTLVSLYRELVDRVGADKLAVLGDSAGGGMALALAQRLKEEGLAQPRDIVLISPWLDITMSNPEIPSLDRQDAMLSRAGLVEAGRLYAQGDDPDHYLLSPINGDLTGLGRLSAFIGTHDLFLADCRRLRALMEGQDIELTYREYEGMFHVWAAAVWLPESAEAIRHIAESVNRDTATG